MAPYLGEIRMFAGTFAPQGWAFCEGQLLSIAENDALFALIGTTYGGDGESTFALPDLRGRIAISQGQGPGISQSYMLAEMGGTEEVTLTTQQIPQHSHVPMGSSEAGSLTSPSGGVWAASALNGYTPTAPDTQLSPAAVSLAGGSQPHENMLPFLTINFIISLYGIFPTQY